MLVIRGSIVLGCGTPCHEKRRKDDEASPLVPIEAPRRLADSRARPRHSTVTILDPAVVGSGRLGWSASVDPDGRGTMASSTFDHQTATFFDLSASPARRQFSHCLTDLDRRRPSCVVGWPGGLTSRRVSCSTQIGGRSAWGRRAVAGARDHAAVGSRAATHLPGPPLRPPSNPSL
jgi:hypothetical protein